MELRNDPLRQVGSGSRSDFADPSAPSQLSTRKPTWAAKIGTSAGAISGLMRCSKLRLLDDRFVCADERRRGKIEAEHFSGLEVDDQLVFGRRLQCEHFKQP